MSKLPYMQFYVADYLVDTSPLSLVAQGAWMRILCALHSTNPRGTRSMSLEAWGRYLGVTASVTGEILAELVEVGVCDHVEEGNGAVTLTCRRMLREDITKEQTRRRVEKHRLAKRNAEESEEKRESNAASNADVTPKKSEVRSQKSEENQSCAEAVPNGNGSTPDHGEIVFLEFPVIGSEKPWALIEPKVAEYRSTFPGLDVEGQIRKALQWVRDNPTKRKTSKGMPKFLFGWLERAQNRGAGMSGGLFPPVVGTPVTPLPKRSLPDNLRDD